MNEAFSFVLGVDDGSDIDSVFDQVHAGRLPRRLAGSRACSTLFDPSTAPSGKHTAFCSCHGAPYDLDSDASMQDVRREEVTRVMLEQWREYAPNLTSQNVLGSALFTPPDIERHCISMQRGSHHVGAYLPEQLGANRPIPQLSQYRTPLTPGSTCAGRAATQAVLSARARATTPPTRSLTTSVSSAGGLRLAGQPTTASRGDQVMVTAAARPELRLAGVGHSPAHARRLRCRR